MDKVETILSNGPANNAFRRQGKQNPVKMDGKRPNGIKQFVLEGLFEQVWVVNLKRRTDRLAQFWTSLDGSRWPFRRPQVFSAIEGDKVGVPDFWQT